MSYPKCSGHQSGHQSRGPSVRGYSLFSHSCRLTTACG